MLPQLAFFSRSKQVRHDGRFVDDDVHEHQEVGGPRDTKVQGRFLDVPSICYGKDQVSQLAQHSWFDCLMVRPLLHSECCYAWFVDVLISCSIPQPFISISTLTFSHSLYKLTIHLQQF